jgi:hypothetical protein
MLNGSPGPLSGMIQQLNGYQIKMMVPERK